MTQHSKGKFELHQREVPITNFAELELRALASMTEEIPEAAYYNPAVVVPDCATVKIKVLMLTNS